MADWPPSAKKMIQFIETSVYLSASETDNAIRCRLHLKAGRQAEEILSYTLFIEWMSAIDSIKSRGKSSGR